MIDAGASRSESILPGRLARGRAAAGRRPDRVLFAALLAAEAVAAIRGIQYYNRNPKG